MMDGKQIAQSILDKDFDDTFKEKVSGDIEANRMYRNEEKPLEVSYETQLKVIGRLLDDASDEQTKYLEAIKLTIQTQQAFSDISRTTYDVIYAYRKRIKET